MIWERGAGRTGRGHCGLCFTPHGCARPADHLDPCACHIPKGEQCRFPGCDAGLYIAIPHDLDAAHLQVQQELLDQYGYRKDAA